MKCSILSLLLVIFLEFSAKAEIEKTLKFPSPTGRWSVVANWMDTNRGGYLWEIRDSRTGKTYFKETKIADNEALPYRFNAGWSPDGHCVAINIYYGRIAYDVVVIEITKQKPRQISLFPSKIRDYDGFETSGRWLNNTDLAVEVFDVNNGLNHARSDDFVIRFTSHGSKIVKSTGWQQQ